MRSAIAALVLLAFAAPLSAQDAQAPDRIEEDWELIIAEPSPEEEGPQVTTTMSPVGDNSRVFIAFNLNYRDSPFRSGGLQVQAWSPETELIVSESQHLEQCATPGEAVSWTQTMTLAGGELTFDIVASSSTTWGPFGQDGHLRMTLATMMDSLAGYNPEVSAARSGVGWQANRVERMTLLRVRYYAGDALIRLDETPRPISPTR